MFPHTPRDYALPDPLPIPVRPAVGRATMGSNQTVTNSTWTLANIDTLAFDSSGGLMWKPAKKTAFYAPGRGYMDVSAIAAWDASNGGNRLIQIAKNGSRVQRYAQASGSNTTGLNGGGTVYSDVIDVVGGDTIELHVYQDSPAGNLTLEAGTCLTVRFWPA